MSQSQNKKNEDESKSMWTYYENLKNLVLEFLSRHKKVIMSVSALLMMGILFKVKFYNKLIPSSDIMKMMQLKEF